jgi:hypothetical protein
VGHFRCSFWTPLGPTRSTLRASVMPCPNRPTSRIRPVNRDRPRCVRVCWLESEGQGFIFGSNRAEDFSGTSSSCCIHQGGAQNGTVRGCEQATPPATAPYWAARLSSFWAYAPWKCVSVNPSFLSRRPGETLIRTFRMVPHSSRPPRRHAPHAAATGQRNETRYRYKADLRPGNNSRQLQFHTLQVFGLSVLLFGALLTSLTAIHYPYHKTRNRYRSGYDDKVREEATRSR